MYLYIVMLINTNIYTYIYIHNVHTKHLLISYYTFITYILYTFPLYTVQQSSSLLCKINSSCEIIRSGDPFLPLKSDPPSHNRIQSVKWKPRFSATFALGFPSASDGAPIYINKRIRV